jgi:hypothetical protein
LGGPGDISRASRATTHPSEVVQCGPGRRHTSACRAQPHLLPAGALLHLQPAGALLHLQPAGASPRLDGADRQPLAPRLPGQPLHAAEPSKHAHACQSGTSCRSEKNPPLTHGDPAEAGPPGQSQPSRVHPVKQQAGAMRTRTGAQPSSSSCASPVARICAYLPTGSGGGRHPKTRLTSPPPCGIAREKPPKWRSATPARIPPLPPPARPRSLPTGSTASERSGQGRCPTPWSAVARWRRALRDVRTGPGDVRGVGPVRSQGRPVAWGTAHARGHDGERGGIVGACTGSCSSR